MLSSSWLTRFIIRTGGCSLCIVARTPCILLNRCKAFSHWTWFHHPAIQSDNTLHSSKKNSKHCLKDNHNEQAALSSRARAKKGPPLSLICEKEKYLLILPEMVWAANFLCSMIVLYFCQLKPYQLSPRTTKNTQALKNRRSFILYNHMPVFTCAWALKLIIKMYQSALWASTKT